MEPVLGPQTEVPLEEPSGRGRVINGEVEVIEFCSGCG